ncbi:MAG: aspartate dehydrogenase [Nitrospinota bacterium]
MLTIGIVGLGAIGRAICLAVEAGMLRAKIAAVISRDGRKAQGFLSTLRDAPRWGPLDELIDLSDLVVEAAGAHIVPALAEAVFDAGKDLMVISVGALLDRGDLLERARREGRRMYVPTGALAGLDGVKSAAAGRVDRVVMTTRKPPRALSGAPHLVENGISVEGLAEPKVVFEGCALEACRGFPENLNVCAGLSLAGLGPERTEIRIVADPRIERNLHDIELEGEAGRFTVHIENIPTENPRTGRLTAMSIIASLREIVGHLRVGT